MEPQVSMLPGPIMLLKSAWTVFKSNWKILVPIVLVPNVISALGQFIAQGQNAALIVLGVLVSIAGGILSIAAVIGIVDAVSRVSNGPATDITLKSQYKFGFTKFWSFVLVAIIIGFSSVGAFFLFLIPGIIISVYACVYLFTFVLDGKKGFSAVTESFSLVRGRWWPVFGRLLVFVVAILIVTFIISFIGGLIDGISHVSSEMREVSPGSLAVMLIVNIIINSLITPFAMVYLYKLYNNLKATRLPETGSTKTFKGWLIAFICVGAVGLVLLFTLIPFLAFTALQSQMPRPEIQDQLRSQLEGQLTPAQIEELQRNVINQ